MGQQDCDCSSFASTFDDANHLLSCLSSLATREVEFVYYHSVDLRRFIIAEKMAFNIRLEMCPENCAQLDRWIAASTLGYSPQIVWLFG